MNVDAAWDRVEALLARTPEALDKLAGGASAAAIRKAEKKLDVSFSDAYRQSVTRHDGQAFELPWLVGGGRLLPLDDVVEEWRVWRDLARDDMLEEEEAVRSDDGVAAVWWSPAWIPFVDRDGDQLCLDLGPASGGRAGQVITLWHEIGVRERVAEDFGAWLELWAADLEDEGIEGETRCWPSPLPPSA